MHDEHWSKGEKAIARRAFDAALSREYSVLIKEVRRRANSIADPGDIWELHDFLSESRKKIDEKYDYRYSVLVFIFVRLIREGWLTEGELAGLDEEKLARIRLVLEI
jgi:photoprotection regulator FRP-like protein